MYAKFLVDVLCQKSIFAIIQGNILYILHKLLIMEYLDI